MSASAYLDEKRRLGLIDPPEDLAQQTPPRPPNSVLRALREDATPPEQLVAAVVERTSSEAAHEDITRVMAVYAER